MPGHPSPLSFLPSFSFKIVFTDSRGRGFCAADNGLFLDEVLDAWCDQFVKCPQAGHFSVCVLYVSKSSKISTYLKLFLLKNV